MRRWVQWVWEKNHFGELFSFLIGFYLDYTVYCTEHILYYELYKQGLSLTETRQGKVPK